MGAKLPPLKVDELGKDVDSQDIAIKKPEKCAHYFELVQSKEIRCRSCGAGFYIGFGDELKHGHLYHAGKKIL